MQDTTPAIPKEIVITCGLFLVILVIGTLAFDLYTRQENTMMLTSATVADTNKSNAITGRAIGITGASTADNALLVDADKQIGVYRVLPSFSFIDTYHLTEEYNTLQKQIRLFYDDIDECRETYLVDDCIATELNKKEYASWLDDCETNEEQLFYDFTELFSKCLASADTDCTCTGTLAGEYTAGEYAISIIQDEEETQFSLNALTESLPLSFEIEENVMTSAEYIIHADRTGTIGSFSSLEPSSVLYLYKKDDRTISAEDESTFTTYELTRSSCEIPKQEIYKFCMQSDTIVSTHDTTQSKTITQPVVYMFAIDFTD